MINGESTQQWQTSFYLRFSDEESNNMMKKEKNLKTKLKDEIGR
jgi:hypothetical protein